MLKNLVQIFRRIWPLSSYNRVAMSFALLATIGLSGTVSGAVGRFTNTPTPVGGALYVQQAELLEGTALFRSSLALSNDGNTALIGASPIDAPKKIYVFTRSGTTWVQQAELKLSGDPGLSYGDSVVLSANGNIALIGAPFGGGDGVSPADAAYIFTRKGTHWTPQAKLNSNHGPILDNFGQSVALSGDGTIALIGAPGYGSMGTPGLNILYGSAYLFSFDGTKWTQQLEMTGAHAPITTGDEFGQSVALSSDGTTAVVAGAFNAIFNPDGSYATDARGSALVFKRSGTQWAQQAVLLSPNSTNDRVATSHDGRTVLLGPGGIDGNTVYVYSTDGMTWAKQSELSYSVILAGPLSLSADGCTALIGIPVATAIGKDTVGAAYVFKCDGTGWSQRAELAASDSIEFAGYGFGEAVALSGDGSTIMVRSEHAVYAFALK